LREQFALDCVIRRAGYAIADEVMLKEGAVKLAAFPCVREERTSQGRAYKEALFQGLKDADLLRPIRFVQSHFPLEIEVRRINKPVRQARG